MNKLCTLPCLDSPQMALQRQRELAIPRQQAAQLGLSAVAATQQGHYALPDGGTDNRTDDGTALDNPWLLSFITSAAPYAPAFSSIEAADMLERRIHRMLAIARGYGYTALVLGAWGCGAFGNDPRTTATAFRRALEGPFHSAFADIVFAITDWPPERRILGPFRDAFEHACRSV